MEESGTSRYKSIGDDDDDDDDSKPITSSSLEIEGDREGSHHNSRPTTPGPTGGGPGAAVISGEEAESLSNHPMSGVMSFFNGFASMLGIKGSLPIGYA